ncbi:sperm-associated antigen 7 homolog [Pollicipes pollicipes]|uniref:sperm-associated antigen 7 homolog n=1 Tax=Pollicipes pollicipes TaxID=41117 RepID=UPI001885454C|nr:sperm-associated antigen 7 homolog [Pollicipes pollicipes]
MDLLGSIMSKMEKPPVTTTQAQREAKKKQIEEAKKTERKRKGMLLKFRKEAETEVQKFMKDDVLLKKQFPPMNEVQRSILHDVAEVAGLVCHAFGEEGVDRHIMLFKEGKRQHLFADDSAQRAAVKLVVWCVSSSLKTDKRSIRGDPSPTIRAKKRRQRDESEQEGRRRRRRL